VANHRVEWVQAARGVDVGAFLPGFFFD